MGSRDHRPKRLPFDFESPNGILWNINRPPREVYFETLRDINTAATHEDSNSR